MSSAGEIYSHPLAFYFDETTAGIQQCDHIEITNISVVLSGAKRIESQTNLLSFLYKQMNEDLGSLYKCFFLLVYKGPEYPSAHLNVIFICVAFLK